MISELEYRLQTVPRWGIVRTIQKQTVAEHSFYVALIAPRIAIKLYRWSPADPRMYDLHRYALLHDQLEAVTGDVPAIAKTCVDEQRIAAMFGDHIEEDPLADDELRAIVKVADLYETARFLATEMSMGNIGVRHVFIDVCDKLASFGNTKELISDLRKYPSAPVEPMV